MALTPGFEPGPHWWEAPLFTLCWSVSSGISMQWCHWLLLSIQGEVIILFVVGFGFRMTWRIMHVLEGVMGLCPTAAILFQETKVALFYLSSLSHCEVEGGKTKLFSVSWDNMAAVWIRPVGWGGYHPSRSAWFLCSCKAWTNNYWIIKQ